MNLGFGAERPTRVRQIVKKPEELFRAKPFTTAGGWGIAFQVPFSFVRLYFPEFAPGESAGNFYKCGDQTPTPHFLAWAPLSSPTPDFHRRWTLADCFLKDKKAGDRFKDRSPAGVSAYFSTQLPVASAFR